MPLSRTVEPSYSRIVSELRSRVVAGMWKPGQKVSSEKELAEEFRVCHTTIKKSLKELEREGLLWARRGKGRFVTSSAARPKTWALGIILFDVRHLDHPVMSQRVAGIQEVISQTDYHLNILSINTATARREGTRNDLWMGLVDPRTIDGAIVIAQQVDDDQVRVLADQVPVVWADHPTIRPGLVGVRLDCLGGAYAAARHLADLGHRRIALIAASEQFSTGRDQRDGVRLALQDVIVPGRGSLAVLTAEGYSVNEGRRTGKILVDLPDRPTAVICGSDELALGAYEAIREAGLTVPRDMSLIAWNDTLTLREIPVPLTTIRMNFRDSGVFAAKRLLWLLDHPDQSCESDRIPSELIVRESTAPPGSREE